MAVSFDVNVPQVDDEQIDALQRILIEGYHDYKSISLTQEEALEFFNQKAQDAILDSYYESQLYLEPMSETARLTMDRLNWMLGLTGPSSVQLPGGSAAARSPTTQSLIDNVQKYRGEVSNIQGQLDDLNQYRYSYDRLDDSLVQDMRSRPLGDLGDSLGYGNPLGGQGYGDPEAPQGYDTAIAVRGKKAVDSELVVSAYLKDALDKAGFGSVSPYQAYALDFAATREGDTDNMPYVYDLPGFYDKYKGKKYKDIPGVTEDNPLYDLDIFPEQSSPHYPLNEKFATSDHKNQKKTNLSMLFNQALEKVRSKDADIAKKIKEAQENLEYNQGRVSRFEEYAEDYGLDINNLESTAVGGAAGSGYRSVPGEDPRLTMLKSTPGYQFRYQQGLESLQQAMAAQGITGSGEALERAQEYGQGLAGTYYDNYIAQLNQNLGLTAGALTTQANIASQRGTNQANLYQQLGQGISDVRGNRAQAAFNTTQNMAGLESDIRKHNASLETSVINTIIAGILKGQPSNTPGSSGSGITGGISAYNQLGQAGPATGYTASTYNPATGFYQYSNPNSTQQQYTSAQQYYMAQPKYV